MYNRRNYMEKNFFKAVPRIRFSFKTKKLYLTQVACRTAEQDTRRTYYCITLRVTSNNVFAGLSNVKTQQQILTCSAGKYGVKIVKNKIRFAQRSLYLLFFKDCQAHIKKGDVLFFSVSGPSNTIGYIFLKQQARSAGYTTVFLPKHNVCYNGCRAQKKIRKKRKSFRLFKNV
jgi:hypothetical protein